MSPIIYYIVDNLGSEKDDSVKKVFAFLSSCSLKINKGKYPYIVPLDIKEHFITYNGMMSFFILVC